MSCGRGLHMLGLIGILASIVGVLGGCSTRQVYENVYHGLQTREQIVHPRSADEPPQKPMSYTDYEKARDAAVGSATKSP